MFRSIITFVVITCFALIADNAHAQSHEMNGMIRLKNGWTMQGHYTPGPDGSVNLVSPRGDKWTIPASEIDTVIRFQGVGRKGDWHRFGHYTEIGALAATKNRPDNVTTAAFSFQVVNGYRFHPAWFVGIGIGLDLYATQTTLPLFASLRADLLPQRELTPYAFLDAGHGFDITTGNSTIKYRGGPLVAAGIGLKVHVSERTAFHVQAGFRLQQGSTIENGMEKNYDNQRLALRAGFAF